MFKVLLIQSLIFLLTLSDSSPSTKIFNSEKYPQKLGIVKLLKDGKQIGYAVPRNLIEQNKAPQNSNSKFVVYDMNFSIVSNSSQPRNVTSQNKDYNLLPNYTTNTQIKNADQILRNMSPKIKASKLIKAESKIGQGGINFRLWYNNPDKNYTYAATVFNKPWDNYTKVISIRQQKNAIDVLNIGNSAKPSTVGTNLTSIENATNFSQDPLKIPKSMPQVVQQTMVQPVILQPVSQPVVPALGISQTLTIPISSQPVITQSVASQPIPQPVAIQTKASIAFRQTQAKNAVQLTPPSSGDVKQTIILTLDRNSSTEEQASQNLSVPEKPISNVTPQEIIISSPAVIPSPSNNTTKTEASTPTAIPTKVKVSPALPNQPASNKNCLSFSSEGVCSQCENRYYLSGTGACSKVSDDCYTYNQRGQCTSCYLGWILIGTGKCQKLN